MKDLIVLDTHVLLWSLTKPEELPKEVRQKIEAAQGAGSLIISSISLWEIAMLNFKKRISIYEPTQDFLKTIAKVKGLVVQDI